MAEIRVVVAVDGPLAGQWWSWADWCLRVEGARWIQERHGRRVPTHLYRPAGYDVPVDGGGVGFAVTVTLGPWT